MNDHAKTKLAAHGIRCTEQRAAIYACLEQSKQHPTAEQLYQIVLCQHPQLNVSLATIYNSLETLCDAGLARKLSGHTGKGPARYDADCHCHPHLRDQTTGEFADLPHDLGRELMDAIPQQTLQRIQQKTGYKIERICLELIGTKNNKSK
ncbi:Fur family transcriptional regulator [Mucisphaera sp.]|uniref:Fur family transcriptional regulator n=1 Tax=Mucisphaera sp. TaxID=2913024 RepID=UPI003D0C8B88